MLIKDAGILYNLILADGDLIMIKIITYIPEYEREVIRMILDIQQKEFGISITEEDQPDLKNVEGFYKSGNGNFWIALYKNTVIGTIALKDIGGGKGVLRKMFVKQECRGVDWKVSSALLSTLLGWSSDRDFTGIFLGTTDRFIAAHRFYEKNGFIEIAQDELPENFPLMAVDSRFYKYSFRRV